MMRVLLSQIAQWIDADPTGEEIEVERISINTRTLQPGDLYIAIKGSHFDGNDFVDQAEQAGAFAVIVSKPVDTRLPVLKVEDTRLALAKIAGHWRNRMPARIVGITGSNGKTTAKEMTAAVLGNDDSVLFTAGNLNNDIGVPLTLLRLEEKHRFGVIEMGANHVGEIAYTSRFVQPDVTIITNAGPAHLEGFGSIEGVSRGKGEIIGALKETGTAVLNHDDVYFDYWRSLAGKRKVVSFGMNPGADVTSDGFKTEIVENRFCTAFTLRYKNAFIEIRLNLAGRHNVLNALAASAAGLALGLDLVQIKQGLETVQPVNGRLCPLAGQLGNIVIDDTYNANFASLNAALAVLMDCDGEPWVALGAFGELGPESTAIHQDMGKQMKALGVKKLFATGDDARQSVEAFGDGAVYFETQQALIDALKSEQQGREAILVKGSRFQRMENVVNAIV